MKILFFNRSALTVFILIILQGCSSSGMMTAGHNGKKYWNPGNCSKYRYNNINPDKIHCITDGKLNGTVLEPVSQQQLDNYYREQQTNQVIIPAVNQQNIRNTVDCYRFGDIGLGREIRTFSGMICPMGWLQSF